MRGKEKLVTRFRSLQRRMHKRSVGMEAAEDDTHTHTHTHTNKIITTGGIG